MFQWLKALLFAAPQTIEAGVQVLMTHGRPLAKAAVYVVEALILLGTEILKILRNPDVVAAGLKLVL